MTHSRYPFAIRINHTDPARAAIAEDLATCGGRVSAETELVYRFRSACRRDEALRVVRGWAGSRSVEPADVAPEPATPVVPAAVLLPEVRPASTLERRLIAAVSIREAGPARLVPLPPLATKF